jgi:hypothetical protein
VDDFPGQCIWKQAWVLARGLLEFLKVVCKKAAFMLILERDEPCHFLSFPFLPFFRAERAAFYVQWRMLLCSVSIRP